ncbi:MAG: LuxR family transcriptional regulator, partial [Actinomycetota bacterium]|nr:LuxR family transcriptional regulator [Actinomycetota bacterium]
MSRRIPCALPCGVGKTSLAVETARDVTGDYADGVYLVPLDGLDVEDLVPDEVARALGRRVTGGQDATQSLSEFLQDRQTLLILDNCEHLLGGVATAADELLRVCPELHILATSREPLGVDGEAVYPLPPLGVPPAGTVDIEELRVSPAVQMFVDRASSSEPNFALDAHNRGFIAHICRSVAGIPLAIELAAARLQAMSPRELADHMGNQIQVLTDGQRMALPRHQTLRAMMDASYGLLAEGDQALLRRTCVFWGGFTVGDAVAVCTDGDGSEAEVLDGMSRLVRASLIVAEERDGSTRYRALEPVRQYGAERLDLADEDHTIRFRHASWFAAKAGALAEHSEAGRLDRSLEIGHLDRENFREALRWSLDAEEARLSLTLASGLAPYWLAAGPKAEGHAWLESALVLSQEEATTERFRALDHVIRLGIAANEPVGSRLLELDRLARVLGGAELQAKASYLRAAYAWSRGNLAEAIELAEGSCRLTEEGDGPPSRSR